ncbi:MAG: site-specific integrase, partial [Bacteroidetes bacterium]|nr:site-specific integrase [Bacteroidota bacterium]
MANASVKLIMRPSKRRADGTAPVYLRAIYARQSKEAATGIWVRPGAWNKDKQKVKSTHDLSKAYNARLDDLVIQARTAATGARSASDVIAALDGRAGSLSAYLREYIDELDADKAYWERKKYETTSRKLHASLGQPWPDGSLPWEALTPSALDRFARYCRDMRGNSPNTVRKEMVRLHTVCKKAIYVGVIRPEVDPFLRYKLPKKTKVKRRRLVPSELKSLRALDLEPGSLERVVRDAFLIAVYGHGVRVSDVLRLTKENIVEENGHLRLVYTMQKTGTHMKPKLPPVAVKIITPYLDGALSGQYVFPLLKRGDDADPVSLRKRQQSATTRPSPRTAENLRS